MMNISKCFVESKYIDFASYFMEMLLEIHLKNVIIDLSNASHKCHLLTHCALVAPYDNIDLGWHWLR